METPHGKVNVLFQAHLSRTFVQGFSLVADSNYVASNVGRICRALFEICLRRGWSSMADFMLTLCKAVDRRLWWHQHPLRQCVPTLGTRPPRPFAQVIVGRSWDVEYSVFPSPSHCMEDADWWEGARVDLHGLQV